MVVWIVGAGGDALVRNDDLSDGVRTADATGGSQSLTFSAPTVATRASAQSRREQVWIMVFVCKWASIIAFFGRGCVALDVERNSHGARRLSTKRQQKIY